MIAIHHPTFSLILIGVDRLALIKVEAGWHGLCSAFFVKMKSWEFDE